MSNLSMAIVHAADMGSGRSATFGAKSQRLGSAS